MSIMLKKTGKFAIIQNYRFAGLILSEQAAAERARNRKKKAAAGQPDT